MIQKMLLKCQQTVSLALPWHALACDTCTSITQICYYNKNVNMSPTLCHHLISIFAHVYAHCTQTY